jgi:hypothetical protein
MATFSTADPADLPEDAEPEHLHELRPTAVTLDQLRQS